MKRMIAVLLLAACGPKDTRPGSTALHLNEIVPSNHHSCADETGDGPDWIEIFNASTEDINLADYAISDTSLAITDVNRLGNVVVPAGGVKVLWADGRPELGAAHLPFKLNAGAEKVLFYGPDLSLLDRADWSEAVTDVSFARFPDGTGPFVSCATPTCKTMNGAACVVP